MKAAQFTIGIRAKVVQAAPLNAAATAASEHDGQLPGIVCVAVKEAAGEHDHAVFQEGAFAFIRGLHFSQGFTPKLDLMLVHALIQAEAVLIIGMMRKLMNTAADAIEAWEAHVGEVVVHHERGHTGAVHLESQNHDVKHQSEVIFGASRDTGGWARDGGCFHAWLPASTLGFDLTDFFGQFDSLFDLAHGGEVFVEFLLVALTELWLQSIGIFEHEIENAFIAFPAAAIVKELIKGLLGEDFLGCRGGRGAPRDVSRVDAGKARIGAVAGPLGAEDDAWDGGEFACLGSDELIHGGAHLHVGGGFFDFQSTEDIHLGIMPAFTFDRGGIPETFKNADVLFEGLKRRQ